jgi:hypothetical protein
MQKKSILLLVGIAAAIFVFVKYVLPRLEGFANPDTKVNPKCPKDYTQCPSGDCIDSRDPHQTCGHGTDAY